MADQQMLVSRTKEERRKHTRPPLPPFTRKSTIKKVRAAEDSWNSRNPEKVALAHTTDSSWRSRIRFA
jgi:nuclear transport factor 2 (NTF2) superfamily protein